jgi:hypothetical protein
MLLVYISADRLVSIKIPNRKKFLRNNKNQFIFISFLSLFVFIYYIPIITGVDLVVYNLNGSLETCYFIDNHYKMTISFMNLIVQVIVPFSLTTITSISLIVIIFDFFHEKALKILNNEIYILTIKLNVRGI